MSTKSQKDLVGLVADANIEHAIRGLMERPRALGIRDGITLDIFKEPERDPGVFRRAHEFLRNFQASYQYALAIFDRDGCGHANESPRQLADEVKERLESAGWRNRCAVVVLDPELESWVFVNSLHVVDIIAERDDALYQSTLAQCSRLPNGKPQHPIEVMEKLLRKKRIRRASLLYLKLAQRVSLKRCQDTSFRQFQQVLQTLFPP